MEGGGVNPFNFTDPALAADLIDRNDEVRQVMDLVWSGNNARLAAPRRYGKTSLLRAVEAEAERQGFVPVHVDFFGCLSTGEIADAIADAYASSLRGRVRQIFTAVVRTINPKFRLGGTVVPAELEMSLEAASPVMTGLLDMPLRLYERTGQRCLVVFDEFQAVMDIGQSDALIRRVIQHHREAASYIFAGSHVGMMNALFSDRRRALYTQAAPIPLPPLQADDLGEYIGIRFQQTGKDPGEGFAPLLDAAAGHPQRAMLLAYHLWDQTAHEGTATEETWVAAFDQALNATKDEFTRAWEDYTLTNRRLINAIAANDRALYSAKAGISRSGGTGRSLHALVDRGDIVQDETERTRHRVVDPLFGWWLRAGRPSQIGAREAQ